MARSVSCHFLGLGVWYRGMSSLFAKEIDVFEKQLWINQHLYRAECFDIYFQEWRRCLKGAPVKNRPVKCEKGNLRQS